MTRRPRLPAFSMRQYHGRAAGGGSEPVGLIGELAVVVTGRDVQALHGDLWPMHGGRRPRIWCQPTVASLIGNSWPQKPPFTLHRMAEREGFEPSIEFPLCSFSKAVPSATRPSLRKMCPQQTWASPKGKAFCALAGAAYFKAIAAGMLAGCAPRTVRALDIGAGLRAPYVINSGSSA